MGKKQNTITGTWNCCHFKKDKNRQNYSLHTDKNRSKNMVWKNRLGSRSEPRNESTEMLEMSPTIMGHQTGDFLGKLVKGNFGALVSALWTSSLDSNCQLRKQDK